MVKMYLDLGKHKKISGVLKGEMN